VRPSLTLANCPLLSHPQVGFGSSAAETWLVSVTACNVDGARHCGNSIIGLPVSFYDLAFKRAGLGWIRAGATGHLLTYIRPLQS
jgi:hypothetical protein